jgi:hypothetical protein
MPALTRRQALLAAVAFLAFSFCFFFCVVLGIYLWLASPSPVADVPLHDLGRGPVTIGDVRVSLVHVYTSGVWLTVFGRQEMSEGQHFVIKIRLCNLHATRLRPYSPWGHEDSRYQASLCDEHGNTYPLSRFRYPLWEQLSRCSLDPQKDVEDMLVFRRPADVAKRLILTLPGDNVGASDSVRLLVPRSFAWQAPR